VDPPTNKNPLPIMNIDGTVVNPQTVAVMDGTEMTAAICTMPLQKPERVRIIKNTDTSFKVHFYYPSLDVNQFVIVIMQYTHEMEPIGELKILVSDEAKDTAICQKNTTNTGYNCGMTHTFSHIIPRDKYNNLYYYRVGVAAINKCGDISDFVEPYNVSLRNEKRLFAMTTLNNSSTAAQQQQHTNSNDIAGDTMIYDGIEPQFHHLSKQLGGYPYQALVTGKSAQQNLLGDLLDQSLADNIVNINVTV
jgi:hypothetical protein